MYNAELFNEILEEKGVSLVWLSKKSGVRYNTLRRAKMGIQDWTRGQVVAVCKTLDIKSPKLIMDIFFSGS